MHWLENVPVPLLGISSVPPPASSCNGIVAMSTLSNSISGGFQHDISVDGVWR
jgi:hypothetical protein